MKVHVLLPLPDWRAHAGQIALGRPGGCLGQRDSTQRWDGVG